MDAGPDRGLLFQARFDWAEFLRQLVRQRARKMKDYGYELSVCRFRDFEAELIGEPCLISPSMN